MHDLVVIGGGINGAGIAADAAGRRLSVALIEARDFGGSTSSASSKLIHGGLRYLEHFEFRLVREALAEREVLLAKAPHLMTPLRFRLPHRPHLRPAWMIRLGLFLYDHLARRATLPASHAIRFQDTDPTERALRRGFEYSDVWVDDARLVVANVEEAHRLGADVFNYRSCTGARRENGAWVVTTRDEQTRESSVLRAKALVNAAGPWVKSFFEEQLQEPSPRNVRLIQGSHIVVPKIHDQDDAYILQNEDRRVVFVVPFQGSWSLIGTTDHEYHGDPRRVEITANEVQYLCDVVNRHFKHKIAPSDVVWSYSGVRPLCDDESDSPQAITRDYTIEVGDVDGKLPLVSIFGGKLTTYRRLAEAAVDRLRPYISDLKRPWTSDGYLPGGDIDSIAEFSAELARDYPFLDGRDIRRIAQAYGSKARVWLGDAKRAEDLGPWFERLSTAEVDYLVASEWAVYVDDIVWRRTKLGLMMSNDAIRGLEQYLETRRQKGLSERLDGTVATSIAE